MTAEGIKTNRIFVFDFVENKMSEVELREGRLPALAFHSAVNLRNDLIVVFGGIGADGSVQENVYLLALDARRIDRIVLEVGSAPPRARRPRASTCARAET